MVLKRKPTPSSNKQDIDSFIKNSPGKTIEKANKFGKKIISISLFDSESNWIDKTVKELNQHTARRITRTEVISVAIDLLKGKNTEEILQLIQTR